MSARWKQTLAAGLALGGAVPAAAQPPCVGPAGGPLARGSLLHPRPWPEVPLGATLNLHYQTHVTNAVAARMALYDYDFVRGTEQLNHRGKDRVRMVAAVAPHNPFPVVVEWLPHAPELAERRRLVVLAELTALAGPVPPGRVVVGGHPTRPLDGVTAEGIYVNMLRLTESAGTVPGTGVRGGTSGAATGTGGGGTGAGR